MIYHTDMSVCNRVAYLDPSGLFRNNPLCHPLDRSVGGVGHGYKKLLKTFAASKRVDEQ